MEGLSLSYQFRRAALADFDGCWRVIEQAKRYMGSLGRCQWDGSYPTIGNIEADISNGWAYVMEAGGVVAADGEVVAMDGEGEECGEKIIELGEGSVGNREVSGGIMAYGAVMFTGEPAYDSIGGGWLSVQPYVALHRLCVADEFKGMGAAQMYFREVEKLAVARGIHSFKVDTNYDNAEMLHILSKCGFAYCGEISYPDYTRMGFEKLL